MDKKPNLLWITVIGLGWLFDLLFWNQSFGINFAIYVVLCLIGGFFVVRSNGQQLARRALWLIPLILFFAVITVIRTEPMTVFLGTVFTLLLMGVLAETYLGGRWLQYSLTDYLSGFLKLTGSMIIRPIIFSTKIRREQNEGMRPRSKVDYWPFVRGILIALPILVIFASLLGSADTIFGQQLSAFLNTFFNLDKLPESIFRLIYILVVAYWLAGTYLHAASQSKDENLHGEDKPLNSRFFGFTETTIVLGSVIMLFTAFVIVQFRYFFGGQVYLGAGGLTDSEYARRGFGELSVVAFLSLLMILGFSTITRRETKFQSRAYSSLSVALVALVMVILVSAFQRLLLNELAHGFFRLRTYSHVFYIWLALMLIAVVVLEIRQRERAFALAALIASMGFVISLGVLNVDGFTARQGILRATQGKFLNVADLAALSTDSVPILVDEFFSPSVPVSTHEAIGAILLCRQDLSAVSSSADWRSFNYSIWASAAAIKKVLPQLQGYYVNGNNRLLEVRTPSNRIYQCY